MKVNINMLEVAMIAGAMSIGVYFFMKCNPDMIKKMRGVCRDAEKMMCNKINAED